MLPHRIVGLAGPAGVGKTTTAQALELYLGYERHSFAGPLKEIAQRFFGVDVSVLTALRREIQAGRGESPENKELRQRALDARAELWRIAQALLALDGQCIERAALQFADTWIPASGRMEGSGTRPEDKVIRVWRETQDVLFPKVVFDDVRRPGEVEAVIDRDGVVVWLEGPTAFGDAGRADTKIAAKDCDLVIDVTPAFKVAQGWRARRQAGNADRAFGTLVMEILASELGWDVSPDKPLMPRDQGVTVSGEDEDDLEPESGS